MKKIYLAGPDVFREDAIEHGRLLVKKCANIGCKGLYPMDNVITGNSALEIAIAIRKANIQMLKDCDAVIANIEPFRGPGADNGTTYEIGFADALNKPVILYSNNALQYKDRIHEKILIDNKYVDMDDLIIEDFGLSDNLMFGTHPVYPSFDTALDAMRLILGE